MPVLRDLLDASLDGEWGKGEHDTGLTGMVVIRGTDFDTVRGGSLASAPLRYIKEKAASRKALRPRDLLIEVAGGSKDRPTGRTLYVSHSLTAKTSHPLTCASFCRFVRVDPSVVNPEYLFWHLQALYENGTLEKYHTQHTGVARFQWTTFADSEQLDLPPIDVQMRIAAVLMAYDELIVNNLRRIEILEEMAQAVYREWFVNFRFPGHEDVPLVDSSLGPIPHGWTHTSLAEIADVNSDSIQPKNAPPEIRYIDIASVSPGSIDAITTMPFADAPSRARRVARDGDTIWSTVRPNRRSYALVLSPAADTIASTGFAVLRPMAVPWAYLYLATTTTEFSAYLTNHARGAAYPAVNAEDFEKATVVQPSGDLLDTFAEVISPMFRLREKLRTQNGTLRSTRDLLLPKLMSGEVDVSELDIETQWLAS